MIIDLLRQEHRNIEKLLFVLEQELSVFDRGERPDYEVIWAVIAYFQVFPDAYHHPQENAVFEKLKARDPAEAARSAISRRRTPDGSRMSAPSCAGGRERADGSGNPEARRRPYHPRLHHERAAPYRDGRA